MRLLHERSKEDPAPQQEKHPLMEPALLKPPGVAKKFFSSEQQQSICLLTQPLGCIWK